MGAEKGHARAGSLSRCSSLLGCFNGGAGGQAESYEPITGGGPVSGQMRKAPPTLQLGSKAPKRCFSFSFSRASSRVKEACEQVLEVAKKGSPHISELFAGSQVFVHVNPPKFGPKAHKQTFSPSIGFLHMATSPLSIDSSLPDR